MTGPDARLPHPLLGGAFNSPVPPGSGWPDDPADTSTPVAHGPADVRRLAGGARDGDEVDAAVSVCRACPRLVDWRETVAREKRRSFAAEPYWGRPISGWGSTSPSVLIVGLAPAAHGGNRTGRIFTGDRSGDWLYAALHRAGLAVSPASNHAGDGQRLVATRMLAAVKCAPPDNRPSTEERDTCSGWLDTELRLLLPTVRVVVCLGSFAWGVSLQAVVRQGYPVPKPRPAFGHGARVVLEYDGREPLGVLGCFHPSQQNTFTGKLTEPMLDAVIGEAARLALA